MFVGWVDGRVKSGAFEWACEKYGRSTARPFSVFGTPFGSRPPPIDLAMMGMSNPFSSRNVP
jgi:hypothetical protein